MNRVHNFDFRVVTEFLRAINNPRSLTVYLMMKYGEFDQIVYLEFNPNDYNCKDDAHNSLLATELLRKHEDLPTLVSKVREANAMEKFYECEKVCQITNDRLRGRNSHSALLYKMQRKIADVLGDFDPSEFLDSSGWGPGSTLFIKRREATFANKFRQKAEVTQPLYNLIKPWFRDQFPHWSPEFSIVRHNKVITVPKNAKTDRVIAVEPSLNLYFQKGVGKMISRRLARFGVDLNSQVVNQELARFGSETGLLATIDFSAASDTISAMLVLDLLPLKWMQVLCALRSEYGYVKGSDNSIEYEKFSSMGNGFTFELESLIFWAAAKATVPEDHPYYSHINVFGDDMIIPSDCVEQYRDLCTHIGFTMNSSKSYHHGYYRESCGKHYWDGHDITPIYNRRYLKKDEIMRFHNRVVELSRRSIAVGFRDKRFRTVIKILADASPIKEVVPEGYGDIGLTTSFDDACKSKSLRFSRRYQRGWYSKAYIPITSRVSEDDDAVLLMHLYILDKRRDLIGTCMENPIGNNIPLPQRPKYKRKTLYFEEWPGLGPWL